MLEGFLGGCPGCEAGLEGVGGGLLGGGSVLRDGVAEGGAERVV